MYTTDGVGSGVAKPRCLACLVAPALARRPRNGAASMRPKCASLTVVALTLALLAAVSNRLVDDAPAPLAPISTWMGDRRLEEELTPPAAPSPPPSPSPPPPAPSPPPPSPSPPPPSPPPGARLCN